MPETSYWNRVLAGRLSRRRALAATGAIASGSALLVACGGDAPGDASRDASGLLTIPKDTSSKAVPGGSWHYQYTEPVSFDPNSNVSALAIHSLILSYSMLLKWALVPRGQISSIVGDAAESFELSGDGLTLTMKLRPNHKFDPRPPTSGRAMTAADVRFSFDRTLSLSPFAIDWSNARNPDSPVESLTTPDAKTLVFKLAYPYGSTLDIFARHNNLIIVPQEADGKFDLKGETRGSGPFFLEEWSPSVNIQFRKNPDWYESGHPFLDGLTVTFLGDYSAGLAQFESGSFWTFDVRQEDILRVKRQHAELVFSETLFDPPPSSSSWFFSRQPGSIFHDVRARRAASMLIDRELFISTLRNTEALRNAGLPVTNHWNSHLSYGYAEWIDPRTKDIGEGGKYFQHNPAEAKKLLAAAGYNKATGEAVNVSSSERHSEQERAILHAMWSEAFNVEVKVLDYATSWRQVCQRSAGLDYNGFCFTPTSNLNAQSHVSAVFVPNGKYSHSLEDTPVLSDLARKIKYELNGDRQFELLKQFQREAAVIMPTLNGPGSATEFDLHWPWLENYGAFSGQTSSRKQAYYWYNKAKDPKAKVS